MPIVSPEDIGEEWKEVWKSEYLKTVSAFYNTVGGRLIVGRKDNGDYVGVQNADDALKTVSDSIQNVLRISTTVNSSNA